MWLSVSLWMTKICEVVLSYMCGFMLWSTFYRSFRGLVGGILWAKASSPVKKLQVLYVLFQNRWETLISKLFVFTCWYVWLPKARYQILKKQWNLYHSPLDEKIKDSALRCLLRIPYGVIGALLCPLLSFSSSDGSSDTSCPSLGPHNWRPHPFDGLLSQRAHSAPKQGLVASERE